LMSKLWKLGNIQSNQKKLPYQELYIINLEKILSNLYRLKGKLVTWNKEDNKIKIIQPQSPDPCKYRKHGG
jgi:hypothetical protein